MDNLKLPKLKICYILSTTEGGTWAFEQLRELRAHYDCDVTAVLSGNTGTLVDRFKAESIRVHAADFKYTSPTDIFYLPVKILKLVKFLRQNRFDITHTHLFPSMVIGRLAGWLADVPVRLSMIAGPFHLEAETARWVDKSTAWMDTALLPSCEYSRQLYLKMGVPEERLKVVYYGPDELRFDSAKIFPAGIRKEFGWSENTPVIGMVAYFYPKLGLSRWTPPFLQGKAIKGHDDLIRAASIVLREYPNAKFLLVGGGWGVLGYEVMQAMRSLVVDLGLQENVIFTGHRTDVPSIYRDLDVSVQASLNDNLGGTIEALLMECPTVVTRVGGLVDTVLDGKTGVQVNVADPADLAEGILRLLRDPEAAKLMGKAGRALMLERFTLRSTVKDINTIYRTLSQSRGKSYRLHITITRFLTVGILGFFAILRFFFIDLLFASFGNQDWHPKSILRSIGRKISMRLRAFR